ncbi:unnamed protein product [Sphagnum jensenii]|uniref:C2H2-type domain-containing protein n=1 Tax=Sphagnum jensenii TaxID=128206 RepID=A0ABP1BVQ3_9BRYO
MWLPRSNAENTIWGKVVASPEFGLKSLDMLIRQTIGWEPCMSFTNRPGDKPAAQYLPGWPLLSPSKVQLQKCDKCTREFCSPFNHCRHSRMHRRSSHLDKDLSMKRKHIATFWDKLSPEEAQHIVSSKNCELEDLSGQSAVGALAVFMNQASAKSLPHAYIKAGQELLEIVENNRGVFPLASEQLLNVLDEASEKTFLCGEPPLAVQKYVYQGDAGKIQREEKNLIASLSFILEQTLVKAWMADKEAEALRNQQELVKEEEAAQMKRERHFQKKKKKKSRQKGLKERKGIVSQLAIHELENDSMDEEGPSAEIVEEDDSPTASSTSLGSLGGCEPNLAESLEIEILLGISEDSQGLVQMESGENGLVCLTVEQQKSSMEFKRQELEPKVGRAIKNHASAEEYLQSSVSNRTGRDSHSMESKYFEGSQSMSFKPFQKPRSSAGSVYSANSGSAASFWFGAPTPRPYRSKPVMNRSVPFSSGGTTTATIVPSELSEQEEYAKEWAHKPRRIALFVEPSPFAYVSGYKNRYQNFIRYLRELGDEVLVVTMHIGVPKEFYGAKVIGSWSLPCPWYKTVPLSLALSPRIYKEVMNFKPDIIHASSPGIMVFGALVIAKLLSVPVVMAYHTHVPMYIPKYTFSWLVKPMWFIIKFLHRAADLTLVMSHALGKEMKAAGASTAEKIRIWRKGVDSESFHPRFKSKEMRNRLTNGMPDTPLIVHVGRLGVEKNLDFLKRVMDRIPEAYLAFIGDGPYRADLEQMFQGMNVTFTGMLQGEELSQAYASGDVFITPSESETLGFVVLEAMACGVSVVAARAGGIPDIVNQDGETGFLYTPGDLDDCVKKLRALLESSELREKVGSAGRAEVEKFDWRASTRQVRNEQYSAAIWFWRRRKQQLANRFLGWFKRPELQGL